DATRRQVGIRHAIAVVVVAGRHTVITGVRVADAQRRCPSFHQDSRNRQLRPLGYRIANEGNELIAVAEAGCRAGGTARSAGARISSGFTDRIAVSAGAGEEPALAVEILELLVENITVDLQTAI